MAAAHDRVDELFDGVRRRRRTLITPEGVPLELSIAGGWERLIAFAIDFGIIIAAVIVLALLASAIAVGNEAAAVVRTLVQFAAFVLRGFYFIFFELAWQGMTPGKRTVGLRVVNRDGGELTPDAVVARNLMREVEIFLPLSLLFTLDPDALASGAAFLGWAVLVASLPLWNRERLRAGDLIAGTGVIAMPRRQLARDLAEPPLLPGGEAYAFTHEQLATYGAYELQVLEELLRRQDRRGSPILEDVCRRICRKIGWTEPVPPERVYAFLTDFYTAERAELERGKRYGRLREDKNDTQEMASAIPGKK